MDDAVSQPQQPQTEVSQESSQPTTQQQTVDTTPQQSLETTSNPKRKKWLLLAIVIFVTLVLGASGYYFYQNYQVIQQSNNVELITSSLGEVSVSMLSEDFDDKEQTLEKARKAFEVVAKDEQVKSYIESFKNSGWNIELFSYNTNHFYDAYLEEGSARKYGSNQTLDIKFKKKYKSVEYQYSTYLASLHLGTDASKTFMVNIGEKVGDIEKAKEVVDEKFNKTILSQSRDRIVSIYVTPAGPRGKFYYNGKEYEKIIFSNSFDILSHSREQEILEF